MVADIPVGRHRPPGASLLVDNTFCPLIVSPAQLGADVVLHSLTKFVSGPLTLSRGGVRRVHQERWT
jgi:methionine-gamma-lyase